MMESFDMIDSKQTLMYSWVILVVIWCIFVKCTQRIVSCAKGLTRFKAFAKGALNLPDDNLRHISFYRSSLKQKGRSNFVMKLL